MTIRQLIIGTAIGATALGTMVHRLSKFSTASNLPVAAPFMKGAPRLTQTQPGTSTQDRLGMNRSFGQHTH